MQDLISQTHKFLIKRGKTVAVAESCTGGLVSRLLTQISGSSQYFILGVVAYSNQAKINILQLPASLIAKKGAVSKEVAENLAQSIRKLAKTDFGIGVTGIAGPTGGTAQKPVGTVFIAVSSKDKTLSKKFNFTGSRNSIIKKSAIQSLKLLRTFL